MAGCHVEPSRSALAMLDWIEWDRHDQRLNVYFKLVHLLRYKTTFPMHNCDSNLVLSLHAEKEAELFSNAVAGSAHFDWVHATGHKRHALAFRP